MPELAFHPLANLFPLIEGEERTAFHAAIARDGIRKPLVILDGQILDGRNRYLAALEAGVAFADMLQRLFGADPGDGDDPLDFVVRENLDRRHLTTGQRAMIAAELRRLGWGGDRSKPSNEGLTTEARATRFHIGRATVERAQEVVDHAVPELRAAVDRNEASVSAAAVIARLDPDQQRKVIAEVAKAPDTRKAFRDVVKNARREAQDGRRNDRADREAELGARQRALPAKQYGVILADPEWRFEPRSRETGMDRAADNHYPTSATDAIAARPVETIAAPDCALFLWATAPMLPQALAVMAAWGFDYRTHVIWEKNIAGTGYWFRNRHELLLLGVKGKIPAPAPGEQEHSIIQSTRTEHSAKPDIFYRLIELYFPNLPKIELNARRRRPGWDAWGLEAPDTESPATEDGSGDGAEANADDRRNTGGDHVDEQEAPSTTGIETGAGEGALPVDPVPDLDIPDSLRRVAMTEDEAATLSDLDPSIMPVNERNFVVNLRGKDRSAFTALDRKYLANVVVKFGRETAEARA